MLLNLLHHVRIILMGVVSGLLHVHICVGGVSIIDVTCESLPHVVVADCLAIRVVVRVIHLVWTSSVVNGLAQGLVMVGASLAGILRRLKLALVCDRTGL